MDEFFDVEQFLFPLKRKKKILLIAGAVGFLLGFIVMMAFNIMAYNRQPPKMMALFTEDVTEQVDYFIPFDTGEKDAIYSQNRQQDITNAYVTFANSDKLVESVILELIEQNDPFFEHILAMNGDINSCLKSFIQVLSLPHLSKVSVYISSPNETFTTTLSALINFKLQKLVTESFGQHTAYQTSIVRIMGAVNQEGKITKTPEYTKWLTPPLSLEKVLISSFGTAFVCMLGLLVLSSVLIWLKIL